MKPYEMKHMIVDNGFDGLESVTAEFSFNQKDYSITFNKGDLEILNTWVFENNTSLPANLSENLINAIREDVKRRI